jgi:hypothetical protein
VTDPDVMPAVAHRSNGDVDWDEFDSAAYFSNNYGQLREDDRQIIGIVADFFHREARFGARAIDVGAGANLYPALTMLPFASEVLLYERAFTNRQWMTGELDQPHRSWLSFWEMISTGRPEYSAISDPFDLLARRAEVVKGNIFGLPASRHDLGTMFFVAESITTRTDEFQRAARLFVNSLKPRAPFAAAFMCNSSGYLVGNTFFPACSVDEKDIATALEPVAQGVRLTTVESRDLREGYRGMVVATGRRKA